jgi:YD repeat-containing protein
LRGTVHSPAFRRTYTYDAAHRLQTVTDSRGPKTLTYTYSPGGLRNAMTDCDGNRTTYLYDPVGRLTGLWAPTGDRVAFASDPASMVRKSAC